MSAPPLVIRVRRLPHGLDLALPDYATPGSAAADVRAAVASDVRIEPGAIAMIPTGFAVEIPPGWELQIRPRSGLAARYGVTLPNTPATIDSDYRGEIVVALINHGPAPFVVERGMRIAQLLPARVTRIAWEESDALTETARGAGGFGHSGV